MRRPRKRTVLAIVLAVIVALVGGFLWYVQPQPLLPEAAASMASTADVVFTNRDGLLEWAPADGDYSIGLVVYPGAKVPPEAYGPLAQEIAASGYLVVITPMPFNFAVFNIGAADRAITAHPEVATWAMAGHSLGGSMAAQYTSDHLTRIAALAMWASYSAADLSTAPIEALSIFGSLDAGADKITAADTKAKLPPSTVYIEIPGGNHEQMGWYTGQPNDPVATIERADQQHQVAEATVTMLEAITAP